MDELSAWQDINPGMVSAPRPELPAPSSDRLKPATNIEFRNELTACLALVVPVGMTEEGRREWLAVAWATVGHLPADLLRQGAKKARETCDHPSKIVPTILAETKEQMGWRRDSWRPEPLPPERQIEKHEEPMTLEQIEEANLLFKSLGIRTRYFADGTARQLEPGEIDPVQPA